MKVFQNKNVAQHNIYYAFQTDHYYKKSSTSVVAALVLHLN